MSDALYQALTFLNIRSRFRKTLRTHQGKAGSSTSRRPQKCEVLDSDERSSCAESVVSDWCARRVTDDTSVLAGDDFGERVSNSGGFSAL
jgi:hypothetical protein